MNQEMERPTKCDWCDAKFDYDNGSWITGDHVCPDCADYNESID
jgi:hypothetical protein